MSPCSIVLFLLALTFGVNGQPTGLNSSSDEYDYFLLVRQWGTTFCDSGHCAVRPVYVNTVVLHCVGTLYPHSNRFSIHGLWPERLDGSWPSCCDSDFPFRIQKILDLLPELAHDWFSYTSGIKYQCRWDAVTKEDDNVQPAEAWTTRMASRVHKLLRNTFVKTGKGRTLLGDDDGHKHHVDDNNDEDTHDHHTHHDKHAARHHHHDDDDDVHDHHHDNHPALKDHHHFMHHAKHNATNRDSPNSQFWRHEWEKHGTCSLDVLENEKEYFETAYLHDADIVPAANRYLYKDVVNAIARGAGASPFVSCRDGDINEVWLCFDKELHIMDCPPHDAPSYQRCGKYVQLPSASAHDDE